MYLRFIVYAFLIYLLYRLLFHFIIPVYKTTRHVKNQFRDLHSRMEEQMNQQSSFAKATEDKQAGNSKKPSSKEQGGDYIEFEEVK